MLICALEILTQSYQLNVTFDISCTFSFFFFLLLYNYSSWVELPIAVLLISFLIYFEQ